MYSIIIYLHILLIIINFFMNIYHIKETCFVIKNDYQIFKIQLYIIIFTINHHYSVI